MGTVTTASTGCTPFDVRRRVVKRKRAENVIRRRPSGCLVLPRPARANSGQAEPSPESVRFGKCEIKILDKVAQAQAEGDDKRNGNGNVPFFSPVAAFEIYIFALSTSPPVLNTRSVVAISLGLPSFLSPSLSCFP